ncbi:hypothetical protein [Thiocystis violascens]|uniref:Uncharacterized protein n=1 Tax=Thiocystis violascens (strain ATCC 17096 / DSM 198 / 6111) TaxID=765911 RepID=I3YGT3_THIV6|nr:hypothetical protein [Thiocystis violascens]AFL76201.1 hypothetical protein Thivi_4398 [Thiocystis violascens DSM 198]
MTDILLALLIGAQLGAIAAVSALALCRVASAGDGRRHDDPRPTIQETRPHD